MGIKVHVGCQSIYLRDWVNLDVPHPCAGLAVDYPVRVERNITDESDYYGRKSDKTPEKIILDGPESNTGDVCDVYGSFQMMPFEDGSVDEILSRQCFEHLSKPETILALLECRRVLKDGGILRLDVPDHDETLDQWQKALLESAKYSARDLLILEKAKAHKRAQTQIALMRRHLLGSRKNDWAYHMGSWTREALIEFCERFGFQFIEEEKNIHFYPAISLRFCRGSLPHKSEYADLPGEPWKAAWQYCGAERGEPLTVPDHWHCLEVGPGLNPWPRANEYVDINSGYVQDLRDDGKSAHDGNVDALPDELNGRFDFVFASHVLEHCGDPVAAAAGLSRVAKAGCVVCPSPMKEGLFAMHEQDHKWQVIAGRDCLYFHRTPLYQPLDGRAQSVYEMLYSSDVSGQMHRLFRYGDRRLEGMADKLRMWWHKAEPFYDIVFHWQGSLKVIVCE